MKKIFSLFLSLLFVMGICFSAPVAVNVSAVNLSEIENSYMVPMDETVTKEVSSYTFCGEKGNLYFMINSKGFEETFYRVEIFSSPDYAKDTQVTGYASRYGEKGSVPFKLTWNFSEHPKGVYYGKCYTYVRSNGEEIIDDATIFEFTVELLENHNYENGESCKMCGYEIKNNFNYRFIGNEVAIEGYKGIETNVVIPEKLQGIAVTQILDNAFRGTNIKSITISDNVNAIGSHAFADCMYLEEINIGKGITEISNYAFAGCGSLKSVVIPGTVKTVGVGAFSYNEFLETVEMVDGTRAIRDSAFRNCYNLKSVVIPDTVVEFGSAIFEMSGAPVITYEVGTKAEEYVKENWMNGNPIPYSHEHKPDSEWLTEEEATCVDTGVTYRLCTLCGEIVERKMTPATGEHKFVNNTCIDCGKKKVTVKSLATPLVTASISAKGVIIKWDDVKNAEYYIVYRKTYNASTKKWSSWATFEKSYKGTSYTDASAELGEKYQYTVRAVAGTVRSSYKATPTVTYNLVPTVKIANDPKGIKVTWTTAANADGYTVYRSQYNAKTKKWSSWSNRGTAKANKTSWVDKSVTNNVQYKYTVRAVEGKFKSSYKASATTLYLITPTVKSSNTSTGIKVTWNKISNAKSYVIYRAQYNDDTAKWSSWKNLGTLKSSVTSYTDKNASSGIKYKYTVRAVNGKYKSAYVASADLIYLSMPTVKSSNASTGVKVSWSAVEGATQYEVYRSSYNAKTQKWSNWGKFKTINDGEVSCVDTAAKSGTNYKYTVRAVNNGSKSAYVSSATLLYLSEPKVTISAVDSGVKVSWSKVTNATTYGIYRSQLNEDTNEWSSWKGLLTVKSNVTSWTDNGVEEGVKYRYTVRAVNNKAKSSYKASNSLVFLNMPTVIVASTSGGIRVNWTQINNAASYSVYRSEYSVAENSWTSWFEVVSTTDTMWVDKNALKGIKYKYSVRAVNGDSMSAFMETVAVEGLLEEEDLEVNQPENMSTERKVDIYKTAINKAKNSAESVTLVKSGAVAYKGIAEFEGALASVKDQILDKLATDESNLKVQNTYINRSALPPAGMLCTLTENDVESAICEDVNDNYLVTVTAKNDSIGVISNLVTKEKFEGLFEEFAGLKINNAIFNYENVRTVAVVDKETGNLLSLKVYTPCIVDCVMALGSITEGNVKIGVEFIDEYAINDNYFDDVTSTESNHWTKSQIVDFYKTAVLDIKQNINAGYSKLEYQAVLESDFGAFNNVFTPVLEKNIVTEDSAQTEIFGKKTEEARNEFVPFELSDYSSVKVATKEELPNGNYKITIVMLDEESPLNKESSNLAKVSNSIVFVDSFETALESGSSASLVKEVNNCKIVYPEYLIVAEMTKEGRFVELYHATTADISFEYTLAVLGGISSMMKIQNNLIYTDFNY